MRIVQITPRLMIADQPTVQDFETLASRGCTMIINARPDGEDQDQPGNAAERSEAEHAGLSYRFIPVTGATIREADVWAFQEAMRQSKGAVIAHCKSGMRAITLFVLGEVLDGRMKRDDILSLGRRHGFDLQGALNWLDRHAKTAPQVAGFFDPRTWSIQYVVSDPATKRCAIIDPVHDFDEKSGATGTMNADAILAYVAREGLSVEWILDTHPHADHFSAAHYLKQKTGAPTAIGSHVTDVQALWKDIYNWPDFKADGSQWDRLFEEGDTFTVGSIEGRVMFSPGHTLASVTYVIGDAAFVHDTMFMPDSGTARADFPGGSASALWSSLRAILALGDEMRLFTGHDYQPNGRMPKWESTVGEQRQNNQHLADMTEEVFIHLRQTRDRRLPMPKLILPALQVNLRGGRLPEPEGNGKRYLKLPIDALEGAA